MWINRRVQLCSSSSPPFKNLDCKITFRQSSVWSAARSVSSTLVVELFQAKLWLIFTSSHRLLCLPCPPASAHDLSRHLVWSRPSQWERPGFQQSGNSWTWELLVSFKSGQLFTIIVIFVPSHTDNTKINLQSRNMVLEKWQMCSATSRRPVITLTLAGQLKKENKINSQ